MKKSFILLLIIVSIFLSSCIKMDSNLIVNDDLSMDWVVRIDYTQYFASASWFSASFWTWTWTEVTQTEKEKILPCDELSSGTWWLSSWNFEESSCVNIDDNIAEVTSKWWSIKEFVTIKDWKYKLDLKWISNSNSKDEAKTEEENIQSIMMMKSMGLEINYSIELPTDIIDANVWVIDGKKLIFSVYDLVSIDEPYVYFKDNGNLPDITEEPELFKIDTKFSLLKKLILSKKELEKTYQWRKDKIKFDKLIPNVDDEKILDLYSKLDGVDFDTYKFRKYKNLLNYLYAKIWLEIHNRKLIKNDNENIEEKIYSVIWGLNNYEIFKNIFINWQQVMYWEFKKIGDDCWSIISSWILINWKWVKYSCNDNSKVNEVEYIVDNIEVSDEEYIRQTYNTLREQYNMN